jgi:hypothetical protein
VTDESLFREVDEEVRQEEYQKLWQRHRNLIIGGVALVVAAAGGFQGWRYYSQKQAEDSAVIYFDALKKAQVDQNDDAVAALKLVQHAGFAQLAKLEDAALLAEKGDTKGAVAAYDAYAADSSNEKVLRDLARIKASYLLIDTATNPDEHRTRLGEFTTQTSPWRHQAREIIGLTAWRTGDIKQADLNMSEIVADPETPAAMRQRALMMQQLIAPKLPPK